VLDAVCLYYRDIFSVAKDKGFLSCSVAKLATIYAQLGFKLDLELSIICFEFCFVSCSGVVLVGRGRVLFCYRDFDSLFGRTRIPILPDE
jgi:hypothetical protein